MAFINKILGKDEREEQLKQELKSMELRKGSIVASIDGEIGNMRSEQKRILLDAGQHAYDIWCQGKAADLTSYFGQVIALDEKIAQEEIRKKEIAARYDEEIKLISSNLNAGVVNTNVSPMNAGVAAGAFACPKCGVAVGNDDVFCQNCGNKLR